MNKKIYIVLCGVMLLLGCSLESRLNLEQSTSKEDQVLIVNFDGEKLCHSLFSIEQFERKNTGWENTGINWPFVNKIISRDNFQSGKPMSIVAASLQDEPAARPFEVKFCVTAEDNADRIHVSGPAFTSRSPVAVKVNSFSHIFIFSEKPLDVCLLTNKIILYRFEKCYFAVVVLDDNVTIIEEGSRLGLRSKFETPFWLEQNVIWPNCGAGFVLDIASVADGDFEDFKERIDKKYGNKDDEQL